MSQYSRPQNLLVSFFRLPIRDTRLRRAHPNVSDMAAGFIAARMYVQYMDVSENGGFSPQIIHFDRVFHYKPSILGYPYFWKHPYANLSSSLRLSAKCLGAFPCSQKKTRSQLHKKKQFVESAKNEIPAVG